MCSNSCKLNREERDELEMLRREVKILKDLCLPEKFNEMWRLGWFSYKLASDEGDTSIGKMNELFSQDREFVIQTELENLEKD